MILKFSLLIVLLISMVSARSVESTTPRTSRTKMSGEVQTRTTTDEEYGPVYSITGQTTKAPSLLELTKSTRSIK
ncbi:unnamed protein product [Caenorhabditis angaria]|uniref:Uncharacterized protein n=1 Tax=Caenorhabditis angaria TaxID=860376 RepID=A0A9P1ID41_9PELO|nr:unnamed protein product [Caenorhabditis angaria]CAI5441028.1 unnamed protein product [Caenorhabditis angaria]